jgi:hypothetical protein
VTLDLPWHQGLRQAEAAALLGVIVAAGATVL